MITDIKLEASQRYAIFKQVESTRRREHVNVQSPQIPQSDSFLPRRYSACLRPRTGGGDWCQQLSGFLFECEWRCGSAPQQFCHLLYVLIAFELHTSVFIALPRTRSAILGRDSVKVLLPHFKSALARITKEAMHPEDRPAFSVRTVVPTAAKALGLRGAIPACAAWPVLSDGIHERVVAAMRCSQKQLPTTWQASFRQGLPAIPRAPMLLARVPWWRGDAQERQSGAESSGLSGTLSPVLCPLKYGNTIVLHTTPFPTSRQWPKHRCENCKVEARCSKAVCVKCFAYLPTCQCSIASVAQPKQTSLTSFFS